MSEQVRLPKGVAEAIEKIRDLNGFYNTVPAIALQLMNFNLLRDRHPTEHKHINELEDFAKYNPLEYVQALVNGYEVEETPEDKVRELYNTFMQPITSQDLYKGELVARAIKDTLDMLGIRIKGVNAE